MDPYYGFKAYNNFCLWDVDVISKSGARETVEKHKFNSICRSTGNTMACLSMWRDWVKEEWCFYFYVEMVEDSSENIKKTMVKISIS